MRLTKFAVSLLSGAAVISIGAQTAHSAVIPGSELLNEYLVIATGSGARPSDKLEAFSMSDTELGADQEVLSQSDSGHPQRLGSLPAGSVPNLRGVFAGTAGANASLGGNRWNDSDNASGNGQTSGEVDRLPGARPLFEGIDFSGNVAVTGNHATFFTSNSDVNANTGVQCRIATASCTLLSSNNSYFDDSAPNANTPLTSSNGVSQFTAGDLNALIVDLEVTRAFIAGLAPETVFSSAAFNPVTGLPFTTGEGASFTSAFVNRNIKESVNGVVVTDLDAIDANDDGFAVIDIDALSAEFSVNNTDWILKSTEGTLAIFRLIGETTQYKFANSSIMLGDGNANSTHEIDRLGAIFYTDAHKGTNEVIDLSNVVLGGIGMWDFTDFNPNPRVRLAKVKPTGPRPGLLTKLNLQNAQGCAQFIGQEIDMSDNRWQRCDQIASVPEPSVWLLLGSGLIGLEIVRRTRRVKSRVAA